MWTRWDFFCRCGWQLPYTFKIISYVSFISILWDSVMYYGLIKSNTWCFQSPMSLTDVRKPYIHVIWEFTSVYNACKITSLVFFYWLYHYIREIKEQQYLYFSMHFIYWGPNVTDSLHTNCIHHKILELVSNVMLYIIDL